MVEDLSETWEGKDKIGEGSSPFCQYTVLSFLFFFFFRVKVKLLPEGELVFSSTFLVFPFG